MIPGPPMDIIDVPGKFSNSPNLFSQPPANELCPCRPDEVRLAVDDLPSNHNHGSAITTEADVVEVVITLAGGGDLERTYHNSLTHSRNGPRSLWDHRTPLQSMSSTHGLQQQQGQGAHRDWPV